MAEERVEAKETETSTETRTEQEESQISQISDMVSFFDGNAESKTEEESEEKEEPEKEEEEIKEEKEESTEETETEETEDPRDKKIRELEEKLQALIDSKTTNPKEESKEPDTSEEEKEYFKTKIEELQKDLVSEYVTDEEYEAVFEKKEKLNEVLKRVQSDTLQGVFRSIPKIIASMIPQHITFYNKTAEFYSKNSDLLAHKKTVGEIIDETAAKNPGWKLDEILDFVGGKDDNVGEVRRRLGLKKSAERKAEKDNIKRPSFAKPAHTRKPDNGVKLTGLDKEISELIGG